MYTPTFEKKTPQGHGGRSLKIRFFTHMVKLLLRIDINFKSCPGALKNIFFSTNRSVFYCLQFEKHKLLIYEILWVVNVLFKGTLL
jgi:hypothetical protein